MSLLNDVMYRPVDPGYLEAAARGPVERSVTNRAVGTALLLVVALVLGVVTVTAVRSLRVPRESVLDGRAVLTAEIRRRTADAEAQRTANEVLSSEIAALQEEELARSDPALAERLAGYEVPSGAVAVTGPGLVLTLDDPVPAQDEEADPRARVQDLDLQILTNGLWAAGAEAIAVNGERLTALSAIRSAGPAVLVDLAPLVPPYRVEAIGDVSRMQIEFARSAAGAHLSLLEGSYGVSTSLEASSSLELPASGAPTLRYAETTVPLGGQTPVPEEGAG